MPDEYTVDVTLQVTAESADEAWDIALDAVHSLKGVVHHAFVSEHASRYDRFAATQEWAEPDSRARVVDDL